METRTLIGVIAGLLATGSFLAFLYFFITTRSRGMARSILGTSNLGSMRATGAHSRHRTGGTEEISDKEMEKFKKDSKKKFKKKAAFTQEELFFHAGIFSDKEKRDFVRLKMIAPFAAAILFIGLAIFAGMSGEMLAVCGVMGVLLGLQLPKTLLNRRVEFRAEEILYYLPLVIEQISIGVSSSLDIGPCIQKVVSMADERDSHNVVTEMMKVAQFYVKSGASLEHALSEVGKLSGNSELKHAFMALSQVARHGGEISRQLQELADAVSTQRETKIEAKIKQLELKATAPVAVVFGGFLIILLIGFGLKLITAF
jgi:Flp pilus assembly protein TadB